MIGVGDQESNIYDLSCNMFAYSDHKIFQCAPALRLRSAECKLLPVPHYVVERYG